METFGVISLLPVTVVIVTAIITRRALEPLMLGTFVGFFILEQQFFVAAYLDGLWTEIGDSAYFIVIFGLFGIYNKLLEDANAISGFTKLSTKFADTKKKTGLLTWIMGNIFFLDNYFSILGNAVSNRKLSDSNKMSRELFAFNVNVVACAICVLVPIALWGVFMSGNIENVLGLEEGTGIAEIAKAVPFMFYAWVSLVFVLLYNFKIIPLFGNMKKAELRAEQTGQVFPDSTPTEQTEDEEKPETNIINFLLPMIALIGTTVVTGELTYGLVVGVVLCLVMYIAQGILKPAAAFDSIVGGFCDMMICTAIVISAFVLQQANDALGLAPFVIEAVQPFMSPNMLPVVTFCVLLSLGFVTGSFWGMAAVCFPIVLPLALAIDANLSLTIGAVISGAAAASTVCFYCDSVTLTCSITKIKNIEYARTALPLAVPMIIVAIILYVIAGFAL